MVKCSICEMNRSCIDVEDKIIIIKTNFFNKMGFEFPYEIIIKGWGEEDSYGWFCSSDKVVFINEKIVNDIILFEKVVYHEFLHLFLQCETKLFYDVLNRLYVNTYFKYLNKFCSNYQITFIDFNTDVMCKYIQTDIEGWENQEMLRKDNSISSNYGQFKMLSEFIVHNSDHYYINNFNDEIYEYDDILKMNKCVIEYIKKKLC